MDADSIRAGAAIWGALDQILQALAALCDSPDKLAAANAMAQKRADHFLTPLGRGLLP